MTLQLSCRCLLITWTVSSFYALIAFCTVNVESVFQKESEETFVKEICEGESLHITCPLINDVILVHTARVGRMRLGRCVPRDYGYIGCSTDVLNAMDNICSGRRSCEFRSVETEFAKFNMSRSSCLKELKVYLEVTYSCNPVATLPSQCDGTTCVKPMSMVLPATANVGHISSLTTMSSNCGTKDCPWIIRADPGMRIELSVIDFSLESLDAMFHYNGTSLCIAYAIAVETLDGSGMTTICRPEVRTSPVVFTSRGNVLELRMVQRNSIALQSSQNRNPNFLIRYQAVTGEPCKTESKKKNKNPSNERNKKKKGRKAEVLLPV